MKEIDSNKIPIYPIDELEKIISSQEIDRIFFLTDDLLLNGYKKIVSLSKKYGVKLKILSSHSEAVLKIARIYDIAGISINSPSGQKMQRLKCFIKRLFDLILGMLIVIALSPIFFIISLVIYIESGRPIFYTQKRASIKNGKFFNVLKFRSMTQNADEIQEDLLQYNETDNLFKMRDDPRVTRIGK